MQAQEQPLTEAALKQLMQEFFGKDVSYHTCSKEGMSADELIAFLRSKKKFIESDAGWQVDSRRICNH
ncbi:MAG: YecH family protein [Shewanella sp.]|nr:YecH family protein [Shewanella sp.]MCF1457841.1 YecH family protein [Shewanella sp.]